MKNKLEIIAETDHWIALNIPSGLLSIPDRKQSEPSLKDWLNEKYGKVWVIHRLDKFTSGLIVFAKDDETHKQLSKRIKKEMLMQRLWNILQRTQLILHMLKAGLH